MNFIVLVKNRLVSIDAILPLLMELKRRNPNARFYMKSLLRNKKTIEENIDIVEMLKFLDVEIIYSKNTRVKRFFEVIKFLKIMLFSKNVVLKFNDTFEYHKRYIRFIKKFSRTTEVYCVKLNAPVLESMLKGEKRSGNDRFRSSLRNS